MLNNELERDDDSKLSHPALVRAGSLILVALIDDALAGLHDRIVCQQQRRLPAPDHQPLRQRFAFRIVRARHRDFIG
jgi:hypothetical protein